MDRRLDRDRRGCERSQAAYTPRGAGSLEVVNTCAKAEGRSSSIAGIATPVPGSANARLRVKFSGFAARATPTAHTNGQWFEEHLKAQARHLGFDVTSLVFAK